ncbi:MAG: GumC family protein [Alphaproteobacteria bacterium]
MERAADAYLGNLSVLPSERSRVLTVRYISSDPSFAALAANAAVDQYILDLAANSDVATTHATDWLSSRVEEMRRRVIDSENRLEEFRRQTGVVDVGGITLHQQQIANLNEELIITQNKRVEAEARYDQARSVLDDEGALSTVAAVLNSKLIQALRDQESLLERKRADLGEQFLPTHPKILQADKELASVRAAIKAEIGRVAANLGNELEIARLHESNLAQEIKRLEGPMNRQREAEITLRALESESRANKQLYETLLSRFKEVDVQQNAMPNQTSARLISRATVPAEPFYPRHGLTILSAFAAAIVFGTIVAVIADRLDSGFRDLVQLEVVSGQPTLASLPEIAEVRHLGRRPHEIAVERPTSAYGEAIRTLRTALIVSRPESPAKTVLFTSSLPGEGKTSAALSLAAMAAQAGQKAIIIDCDLRNPSLHTYLDHAGVVGLSDHLAGQAQLKEVVEIDPRSRVHFIPGGTRAPSPSDLLNSATMRKLLQQLSALYDLVVLDAPPILLISDPLLLVHQVDQVVFAIRWSRTPREIVLSGIKTLAKARIPLTGVVLTRVHARAYVDYGRSYETPEMPRGSEPRRRWSLSA